jgi:hypothetical protein
MALDDNLAIAMVFNMIKQMYTSSEKYYFLVYRKSEKMDGKSGKHE